MKRSPPEKEKFQNTFLCTYLVSVAASWVAEMVTYPLDLTKTRLQIQGEIANNPELKVGMAPYRGMTGTAIGIVREEGLFKLWKGIHAAFCRHAIYTGSRIVIYKSIKEKLAVKTEKGVYFPLWMSAICGASAGALGQFIASPADLLKVQLQMEGKRRLMGLPPRVHGMIDAFKQIVKSSGYKGLWKGSIPNAQRAALVNLGDLTTYDVIKRSILNKTGMKDNHVVHIMSSICAGLVAAGIGTPADVIKTRVMNQPIDPKTGRQLVYATTLECFEKTIRNEGVLMLYRGFVPFFFRLLLFSLLYKSSLDCLTKSVKNEGFASLYKGFLPNWMRMAPWSLSFWLSYEEIMSILGATQF